MVLDLSIIFIEWLRGKLVRLYGFLFGIADFHTKLAPNSESITILYTPCFFGDCASGVSRHKPGGAIESSRSGYLLHI